MRTEQHNFDLSEAFRSATDVVAEQVRSRHGEVFAIRLVELARCTTVRKNLMQLSPIYQMLDQARERLERPPSNPPSLGFLAECHCVPSMSESARKACSHAWQPFPELVR